MSQSLADILNNVQEPVEQETVAEVAQSEPIQQAAEQTGEVKTEVPPTAENTGEPESWKQTAFLDERKKRQAKEAENEVLRKEIESLKAPKEPAKKTDFFEDPDQRLTEERREVSNDIFAARLQISRDTWAELKPDYEEHENVFLDAAKNNQELARQLSLAPNPAKFIYETGKQLKQFNEMQDVSAYEQKIKDKYRAELEAEITARLTAEKTAKKDAAIPPNLSKHRTAAPVNYEPEQTLAQILGR